MRRRHLPISFLVWLPWLPLAHALLSGWRRGGGVVVGGGEAPLRSLARGQVRGGGVRCATPLGQSHTPPSAEWSPPYADGASYFEWADQICSVAPCLSSQLDRLSGAPSALKLLGELDRHLGSLTAYLRPSAQQQLRLALETAFLAHYGQQRRSGEPTSPTHDDEGRPVRDLSETCPRHVP